MESLDPRHLGTLQHGKARDLSRYLIHLTKTEDDLHSILSMGRIEARNAFGMGRKSAPDETPQNSVCFTEMPLTELNRMFDNGRRWGVVFDKERLRRKWGAQPVWYLAHGSPEYDALKALMNNAKHSEQCAPIWELTSFIDDVRPLNEPSPNDWRWEREWRVRGDIEFDLDEIALVVCLQDGIPRIVEEIEVGEQWLAPGDTDGYWSGGYSKSWDTHVQRKLEQFHARFLTIDETGATWDREDRRYYGIPCRPVDTEDAIDEVFGYLMPSLFDALVEALNETTTEWYKITDMWAQDSF